ncbi:Bax inhibitor-1/YccA family protein [Methylovirgula sp. 4M-Z18]|uniref:Bax inhibitor-1/YccA family protein n=1 Tax=Methylovirgula sp. 4M-Z18 TaxID=2293567 RepID=UPI000E2EA255|nr:Bax inhibitor-1/YccA family protein [Methylovirgula sp. 4M-Z18]RFB78485.1 BAX inhibitor (BI)-1/YccA family protein [Methylovirgula sp. 4M-Z18]
MSDFDRYSTPRYGSTTQAGVTIDQGLRTYMLGVYNYMTLGLAITGVVAYALFAMATSAVPVEGAVAFHGLYITPFGITLFASPLKYVVMLLPLGIVFYMSMGMNRMSAQAAKIAFFVFAAAMGASLSSILLVYTAVSITNALLSTTAAFAGLSIYGYTTRRDLSAMGSFMVMGLFGLVIASLINIFMQSSGLQLALSYLAVVIFAGLTAWDTQKIKAMYYEGDGYEVVTKKSIFGALALYLDFINLFVALLRIFGDRRN